MHSAKNYLIGVLALTTAGVCFLAWRQHLEIATLRSAALRPNERAEWQQRIWAAEKSRAELEQQLVQREPAPAPGAEQPAPEGVPSARGSARGGGTNRFAAMMEQPEVQRLLAVQQKAALDRRYAALFKQLALSPAQLEQLKNLLVEKSTAVAEVAMAAREQGVNPRQDRDAFRKLVQDTEAEIEAGIRQALGETGYAQYQQYERTIPERTVTSLLEQRLSYSSTPLTADQSAQMVNILAANASSADSGRGNVFMPMGPGARDSASAMISGPQAVITDTAVQQAVGLLAAPQLDALRQLQLEQQAQRELRAAFRNQAQRTPPQTATPSTPATPGG